jgi:hypothetical protein
MLLFTPCGCGQYFLPPSLGSKWIWRLRFSVYSPHGSFGTYAYTYTNSLTLHTSILKTEAAFTPETSATLPTSTRCKHPRTKLTSKLVTLTPLNQWHMLMEWWPCVLMFPPRITFEPPDEFSWKWAWNSWQWSPSTFIRLNYLHIIILSQWP